MNLMNELYHKNIAYVEQWYLQRFNPEPLSKFDFSNMSNENVIKLHKANKQFALICNDEVSIHKDMNNIIRNIKKKYEHYEYNQIIILDLFN